MRIMVLGAQGMLGKDLVPILSRRHEVVGKDIQDFDITDEKQADREIAKFKPAVVINAAAYTNVDGCESQQDLAFAVNAEGAQNVARACSRSSAAMIQLSTDYVFDGRSLIPYGEDAQPNPISIYGKSKHQGERYIQEILENFLIIRTAWLYGRHGKNFVDTILNLSSQPGPLKVVNDQKGSPTFTKDLSRALESIVEKQPRGVLHVTNSGSCSWYEFAQNILEIGVPEHSRKKIIPISSGELNRPAPRPANSVLDCNRFEELTGDRMRPWQTALKEYLDEKENTPSRSTDHHS